MTLKYGLVLHVPSQKSDKMFEILVYNISGQMSTIGITVSTEHSNNIKQFFSSNGKEEKSLLSGYTVFKLLWHLTGNPLSSKENVINLAIATMQLRVVYFRR